MHFLASAHFSVQSFYGAQVPGVPPWLLQSWPAGLGASHPVPEQLALPLAGLAIKQQLCLLRRDVFYLQAPCAACSHTCPIVSGQSVIGKLLNHLPGLCCSQLLQIPTQQRPCWISFLPFREIFDRCLLLFHGPVLLCFSSEVQLFCFCTFPITKQ